MKTNILSIIIITLAFSSCNNLIEYSPYDTNVENYSLNQNNINNLIPDSTNGLVKFAFISDTHSYYDEFSDAINNINNRDEVKFIICCGDITESGLSWEYKKYHDLTERLNKPLFTAVGNHDYLSNGLKIYKRMFGNSNFSFIYNNYKFIVFDDIVWENNNRAPNFEWLESEIQETTSEYIVLITHIPPWTDQLAGKYEILFNNIVAGSKKIILCLYGHEHTYSLRYINNVPSMVCGSVLNKTYHIITLDKNSFSDERIAF